MPTYIMLDDKPYLWRGGKIYPVDENFTADMKSPSQPEKPVTAFYNDEEIRTATGKPAKPKHTPSTKY